MVIELKLFHGLEKVGLNHFAVEKNKRISIQLNIEDLYQDGDVYYLKLKSLYRFKNLNGSWEVEMLNELEWVVSNNANPVAVFVLKNILEESTFCPF